MSSRSFFRDDRGRPSRPQATAAQCVADPLCALSRRWSPLVDDGHALRSHSVDSTAAMRELAAVHRIEQARLLARASRLRCRSTAIGRAFSSLRGDEDSDSCWRRDATAELDACWLDGWEPSSEFSAAAGRSGWPRASALALARAAWSLDPSLSARVQIARAEMCSGSVDAAWLALRAFSAERTTESCRVEIVEGAALAGEAACRWSDSERAYAALCARPEFRPAAVAALLALALRAGDIVRAARLRESWLGELTRDGAGCSALGGVLEELRARIHFHRRAQCWTPSESARGWLHEWIDGERRTIAEGRALESASLALALLGDDRHGAR